MAWAALTESALARTGKPGCNQKQRVTVLLSSHQRGWVTVRDFPVVTTAMLQEGPGDRWPQRQVAMRCAHAIHASMVMSRPLSHSVFGKIFLSLASCCFVPQRSHHNKPRTCSSINNKTLAQPRRRFGDTGNTGTAAEMGLAAHKG